MISERLLGSVYGNEVERFADTSLLIRTCSSLDHHGVDSAPTPP